MVAQSPSYSVHEAAALREVGAEFFIVTDDRSLHHIHTPTSVALFGALRGGARTSTDLAALLHERFEVSADTAQEDVDRFLDDLVERLIIVRCEPGQAAAEAVADDAQNGG
jgi:hypothetical protein